ncbi:hypothetical protein ACWC4J_26425, partial [Streptomyces sp. NPDC001356]
MRSGAGVLGGLPFPGVLVERAGGSVCRGVRDEAGAGVRAEAGASGRRGVRAVLGVAAGLDDPEAVVPDVPGMLVVLLVPGERAGCGSRGRPAGS